MWRKVNKIEGVSAGAVSSTWKINKILIIIHLQYDYVIMEINEAFRTIFEFSKINISDLFTI